MVSQHKCDMVLVTVDQSVFSAGWVEIYGLIGNGRVHLGQSVAQGRVE